MSQGNKEKVAALILAAGFSSRMGTFKPLLPLGNTTVIEWVVTTFRCAGITDIKVVIGHRAMEMRKVLNSLPVDAIENSNYARGMFSSVKTGVKAIKPGTDAFFLLPVDIPLIQPRTISQILEIYHNNKAGVIYPCFDGERGHPPLISTSYIESILSWEGEGGLRSLMQRWEPDSMDVGVYDQGILMDMDTPEEYRKIQGKYSRSNIPTEQECLSLLKHAGVPEPVVRHCRAVAGVAVNIARALDKAGYGLNIQLIQAAALLHDIARDKANHARAGAEYLRGMGYTQVAGIVETHMDMPAPVLDTVTEAAVVFLADKLVQEDIPVSLEQRFQHTRNRCIANPDIASCIEKRFNQARAIKSEVEKIISFPLESINSLVIGGSDGK